jgi:hypothetical protein
MKFWNNLVFLQVAAVVSALVLTVGAVLEYSHQLKLLTLLTAKWICRKSTLFDRCVFRKLLLHSVGPILVVLGIAGEFMFEGRTFIVEDRQEEQARQIVGSLSDKAEEADRKARAAISESSTALNQAKDALDKAGIAQESLGKAENEANTAQSAASNALNISKDADQIAHGARQEADSFERDIVSAKTLAADAESHLADALKQAAEATAELNRLKCHLDQYSMRTKLLPHWHHSKAPNMHSFQSLLMMRAYICSSK